MVVGAIMHQDDGRCEFPGGNNGGVNWTSMRQMAKGGKLKGPLNVIVGRQLGEGGSGGLDGGRRSEWLGETCVFI